MDNRFSVSASRNIFSVEIEKETTMTDHLPLMLAIAALLASALRATAAVLANRRQRAPAAEQLTNGLGFGLAVGAAFVTMCYIAAPYFF